MIYLFRLVFRMPIIFAPLVFGNFSKKKKNEKKDSSGRELRNLKVKKTELTEETARKRPEMTFDNLTWKS